MGECYSCRLGRTSEGDLQRCLSPSLDTTVLIDNFCGQDVVVPLVQPILDGTTTVWFSVITEAEQWAGIKSSYERVRYEGLLRMKRVPVTKTVARDAGELYGKYRRQGFSLADALIAATARVYKKTLLTRNTLNHYATKFLASSTPFLASVSPRMVSLPT